MSPVPCDRRCRCSLSGASGQRKIPDPRRDTRHVLTIRHTRRMRIRSCVGAGGVKRARISFSYTYILSFKSIKYLSVKWDKANNSNRTTQQLVWYFRTSRDALILLLDRSINFSNYDNYTRFIIWHNNCIVLIYFAHKLIYFVIYFPSSENEFVEILTILKSNPSIAEKLHKAMIKELYNSMNNDLEAILKEGSLQDVLSKIAKLSEESTMSINEDAWSVIDSLKNIFVITQYDF